MKTGLVLEGGGMRGLYTAGVLDVMMDHNWCPNVICGSSAGATFGVNLPSKQRGRVLRYNLAYVGRPDYISLRSLLTTGDMINVEFAYNRMPRLLDPFDDETYMASGTEFYATVTNVETGEAEYIPVRSCFDDMEVIRASASLPCISRKVMLNGTPYLDGGLADNIPLNKCIETGCDRIIVVLTHPKGYVKNENLLPICRLMYPHDKAFLRTIAERNQRYNTRLQQVLQMESEGRIIVLRPSRLIKVGRLEKNKDVLKDMYQLGVDDATQMWGQIEEYLRR